MSETTDGAATGPGNGEAAATTPEGVTTEESWLSTIPETETYMAKGEDGQEVATPLREHPKLKEIKSPADLAKILLNQEKLLGKKTIGLTELKPDATDEEKAEHDREFRRIMGVPEKPEGYEFQFPEGTQVDEDLVGWFKQTAHKHAVHPGAAQGMAADWAERVNNYWANEFKNMEQAEKENLERITAHFGGEEKTAEASELAKRGFETAAKAAGLSEDEMAAFRKVYGNDMTFVRLFHVIGKSASQEHGFAEGSGGEKKPEEDRRAKYQREFKDS